LSLSNKSRSAGAKGNPKNIAEPLDPVSVVYTIKTVEGHNAPTEDETNMKNKTYTFTERCPVEGLIYWSGADCSECSGKGFVAVPTSVFPDGEAICECCMGDKIVWVATNRGEEN